VVAPTTRSRPSPHRSDHAAGHLEVAVAAAAEQGAAPAVDQAEHQLHRGGLPGPVRAQESRDLARLQPERQVVDGQLGAMHISSPPSSGTTMRAWIPLGPA